MKAKRLIALALAAVFMLSAAATPVFAAAALPQENAALEQQNDMVSIRLKATGDLVYGSNYKLEVQTNPADTQYIGVVVGVGGEANGYVTLVLSDKIRTLLKMIPLPKKMSKTPDQAEEFNVYSYLKQLIDGNDVSVLLRVADEAVSVMDVLHFYVPTIDQVSNGLRLALNLIRKYLPEGAFSRIYLDEQPVDAGNYVAGALALESSDMNTAGFAMFKIKPKTNGVRMYWAQQAEKPMTAEGFSRLPEASISILASRQASSPRGRWTAIWSPSKSALNAVHASGCSLMARPSTSTGLKAWMPRRCRVGARFSRTGWPLMTVSRLSQTSGLARSTILRADLMLLATPFSTRSFITKGLNSSRAISLGRPHWSIFSSGPTTITERPE